MQASLAQRANSGRGCSCSSPLSSTGVARRRRPRVSTAAASPDDDAAPAPAARTIPAPRAPPPPPPPPMPLASTLTTVDRRVYDQVAASRTRLAASLSAANAQVRALKRAAAERDGALAKAAEILILATRELREASEDAEAAAAAAAHAVSPLDRSKKAKALSLRLGASAEKIGQDFLSSVDPFVPRRVPLVYVGMATDVRLVGSFDGWSSEGVRLSAVGASSTDGDAGESSGSKSALTDGGTRFEGDAWLLPGRYLVKWVIDGDQYRLAPDWPTEDDGRGSTNNVLVVE